MYFYTFDKKLTSMKKPLLTEKQYNLVQFFIVCSFMLIFMLTFLNHKLHFLPVLTLHNAWGKFLYFVLLPIVLGLVLLKRLKLIPDYTRNYLSAIWPNYSNENYPKVYMGIQVIKIIFVIILLYWMSDIL
jgi:hypothetical protein